MGVRVVQTQRLEKKMSTQAAVKLVGEARVACRGRHVLGEDGGDGLCAEGRPLLRAAGWEAGLGAVFSSLGSAEPRVPEVWVWLVARRPLWP